MEASDQKERKIRRGRRLWLAIVFMLLLWIPSVSAPQRVNYSSDVTMDAYIEKGFREEESDIGDSKIMKRVTVNFTAKAWGQLNSNGEVVKGFMDSQSTKDLTGVLAMRQQGEWLIWHQVMPVVLTIQHPSKGKVIVQSLEKKICDCEPPEAKELQRLAKIWTAQQEANAIIQSAVHHYIEVKGHKPESLNVLTQPFPDNWVAGRSPELRIAFALLMQSHTYGATSSSTGKFIETETETETKTETYSSKGEEQGGKGSSSEVSPYFFDKPLEIVVDKDRHHLALVSGNIIIRSYSIGLGGVNTPEGTYSISDKIMNPNGRSNGEFGSRGMQLSNTNYAIHGTNAPDSIGKDQSLGCIRMRKDDVEELFDLIPKGTKVTIGKRNLPEPSSQSGLKFIIPDRQEQTNPRKTYHWLT